MQLWSVPIFKDFQQIGKSLPFRYALICINVFRLANFKYMFNIHFGVGIVTVMLAALDLELAERRDKLVLHLYVLHPNIALPSLVLPLASPASFSPAEANIEGTMDCTDG